MFSTTIGFGNAIIVNINIWLSNVTNVHTLQYITNVHTLQCISIKSITINQTMIEMRFTLAKAIVMHTHKTSWQFSSFAITILNFQFENHHESHC